MDNMSFDDLGLLLRVIETRMVLHILVMDFDSPYYSDTLTLCLLEM
jgi:hypothetical protein